MSSTDVIEETATLSASQHEIRGNVEQAYIGTVDTSGNTVTISLEFDWSEHPRSVTYDLDDDEDLIALQTLAGAYGLTLEQLSHLEGLWIDAMYTGRQWLPQASSIEEVSTAEQQGLFTRVRGVLKRTRNRVTSFPKRVARRIGGLSTQQWVLIAVIIKKFLIVAIIAALLL